MTVTDLERMMGIESAFRVTFTRGDGTVRVLAGRRTAECLKPGRYVPAEKGLVTVWDDVARGYRTVRAERVIGLDVAV